MNKTHVLAALLLIPVLLVPSTSKAIPMSGTDLWDISNGSVVDATSGPLHYSSSYRSDIRDMFGGGFGTVEATNTLFKDYMSPGYGGGSVTPGYVHFAEWHTTSTVTLRSFSLHASNDGTMNRRAFNRFQLYVGDGVGGWTSIYDTGVGFSYSGAVNLAFDIAPVASQYFRAEFVQAPWISAAAVGPRIHELDGFDTFLDGSKPVPEPTTLAILGIGLAGIGFSRRKRLS